MSRSRITRDIGVLRNKDIYNILLYAIYKCTNDPEYSVISELIYAMDEKSLLKFCSIFGGCTFKVPTLDELKTFTNGLLIYQLMLEGHSFNEAFKDTGLPSKQKKELAKVYTTIKDIIDEYEFRQDL